MSGAVSEATVQAGEVLVNSLSLLGISTSAASREYGCEICAEMFVQPNQKALNTVLHLLFDRILGKETFKKVRDDTVSMQSCNTYNRRLARGQCLGDALCLTVKISCVTGNQGSLACQGQRSPAGLQQGWIPPLRSAPTIFFHRQ